ERRNQHAGTLSGGEQQMLSIARAITTKPALLLLDELSMGLAPLIVEQLYEAVRRIAREGVSVLVVEQFAKPCSRSPTSPPSSSAGASPWRELLPRSSPASARPISEPPPPRQALDLTRRQI